MTCRTKALLALLLATIFLLILTSRHPPACATPIQKLGPPPPTIPPVATTYPDREHWPIEAVQTWEAHGRPPAGHN